MALDLRHLSLLSPPHHHRCLHTPRLNRYRHHDTSHPTTSRRRAHTHHRRATFRHVPHHNMQRTRTNNLNRARIHQFRHRTNNQRLSRLHVQAIDRGPRLPPNTPSILASRHLQPFRRRPNRVPTKGTQRHNMERAPRRIFCVTKIRANDLSLRRRFVNTERQNKRLSMTRNQRITNIIRLRDFRHRLPLVRQEVFEESGQQPATNPETAATHQPACPTVPPTRSPRTPTDKGSTHRATNRHQNQLPTE